MTLRDALDDLARQGPGEPVPEVLLRVLARIAMADHALDPAEVAQLGALLPEVPSVEAWVREVAGSKWDPDALRAALADDDARWTALHLAARVACGDGERHARERALVASLADVLALGEADVEHALHAAALAATGIVVAPDALRALVDTTSWDAVQVAHGAPASEDLRAVLPPDAIPVTRLGLDGFEVAVLADRGLAARFLDGLVFVPWGDIVDVVHGAGLDATTCLRTQDGRARPLPDARLGRIGRLFQRLRVADAESAP